MPVSQALEMARRQDLDLVEVAPTATPPVCRVLDYGKYRYEQSKKEREQRRNQKVSLLREVRLRPKIDHHDFESKIRSVRKLLGEGDKVKVTVRFRGREITHPEIAWGLLQRMTESLQGVAAIARQPIIEGRSMTVILSPLTTQKAKPSEVVKGSAKTSEVVKGSAKTSEVVKGS
jgi:translation initiation factor IF-3